MLDDQLDLFIFTGTRGSVDEGLLLGRHLVLQPLATAARAASPTQNPPLRQHHGFMRMSSMLLALLGSWISWHDHHKHAGKVATAPFS